MEIDHRGLGQLSSGLVMYPEGHARNASGNLPALLSHKFRALAGLGVRELCLPPGCIRVSCREGSKELIPTASTRLEAHVRITAMIAPEAKGAMTVLRNGCEAHE